MQWADDRAHADSLQRLRSGRRLRLAGFAASVAIVLGVIGVFVQGTVPWAAGESPLGWLAAVGVAVVGVLVALALGAVREARRMMHAQPASPDVVALRRDVRWIGRLRVAGQLAVGVGAGQLLVAMTAILVGGAPVSTASVLHLLPMVFALVALGASRRIECRLGAATVSSRPSTTGSLSVPAAAALPLPSARHRSMTEVHHK